MNIGDSLLEKLLNTEYHFLRYQDKYIFFTIDGSAILLNKQASSLIQFMIKERSTESIPQPFLDKLAKALIVNQHVSCPGSVQHTDRQWYPTVLLVSLTNGCSLRCVYCYARAGDFKPVFLDLNIFSAAINLIAQNASKNGEKQFKVHFLGNGESTYNWPQFTEAIRIVRDSGLQNNIASVIHVTTNGILNDQKCSFLVAHADSLTLSLDGLPEHQNKLRPLPNGKPSWDAAFKTAQYFFRNRVKWGLRTTVTRANVHELQKVVQFFNAAFPQVPLRFEPMHYCGRSLDTNIEPPAENIFIREYLLAEQYARQNGVNVSFSGVRTVPKTCDSSFCGIATPNFCLTETGLVTACFNGMSDLFRYGRFDAASGEFVTDQSMLQTLRGLTQKNALYCHDCFARRYCLGDCPSIRITSNGGNIQEQ